MNQRSFFVLIPVMLPESADKIIAELVKRSYVVAPLSYDGSAIRHEDDNMVTIVQVSITKTIKNDIPNLRAEVVNDIANILSTQNILYFMFWVGEPNASSSWVLGNVKRSLANDLGSYRTKLEMN